MLLWFKRSITLNAGGRVYFWLVRRVGVRYTSEQGSDVTSRTGIRYLAKLFSSMRNYASLNTNLTPYKPGTNGLVVVKLNGCNGQLG